MKSFILCFFLLSVSGVWGEEAVPRTVAEDASLAMPDLIKKYGYPAETHFVSTADGYVLTLYRIPYGQKCGPDVKNKIPVLLIHGLFGSSYDYVILGPKKSLGYILADNCYDVWLGNSRGNSQSRKHLSHSIESHTFWKFTWHEMGKYDTPAMIDHILDTTKQPSLHYVGHSQGTTHFFVFAALKPEYQSKVRSMQALSPVVYLKNLPGPLVKFMSMIHKPLEFVFQLIGMNEFMPVSSLLNLLGPEVCKDKYPHIQTICSNIMFLLCGFDEPQLNKTIVPAIVGHTPAGASAKQLIHYAQLIEGGVFRQFDHGIWKNLEIYKSIFPPEYDLTKINVPVAIYYSSNDWFAAVKDVKVLDKKLPNIIERYHVPYSKFNHLDFVYATDAVPLLYTRVLQVMAKY